LRSVVSRVLAVPNGDVSDATSMETVEAWDSIRHLHIVLALEEQFAVSFDEERALEITSVPLIRTALSELGVAF
jgi:acyl carrier protein